MSLKDRIKGKKGGFSSEAGEYKISIAKLAKAAAKVKNPADLGNIVKEFSRFLNAMDTKDAQLIFRGNFDLGQRTLLNCVLSNFIDDGIYEEDEENDNEEPSPSKLVRRRKSVKERLEEENEE